MAKFIYKGRPTAGKNTKDVKIPSAQGWTIYNDVIPNETEINTTDVKEVNFMRAALKIFTEIA